MPFNGEILFGNSNDDIVHGVMDCLLYARLGEGSTRVVYPIIENDDSVIKICTQRDSSYNTLEFEIYNQSVDYNEDKANEWLARCTRISDNGFAMMQERLTIFSDFNDPRLPEKIPSFLQDTKVQNWGLDQNGNVKCCDYALCNLMRPNPWRLVKAKWWSYP